MDVKERELYKTRNEILRRRNVIEEAKSLAIQNVAHALEKLRYVGDAINNIATAIHKLSKNEPM